MKMHERLRFAQNVVAKHGVGAWQVMLVSAVMGFLSVYALALGSFSNALAVNWDRSLTHSATMRIMAPPDEIGRETTAALEALRTTAGIVQISEIDRNGQIDLLRPWLGDDIPTNILVLPRFFSVTIDPNIIDEKSIRARLSAEAPAAIWDNHNRWRGPIASSSKRLSSISWISIGLIALMYFVMIYIAAEASISANAQSIKLLRQIGASDKWTQSGFIRKFVFRSLLGAILGILCASALVINILTPEGGGGIFRAEQGIGAIFWVGIICIILIAISASYFSTRFATRRYLERLN